MHSSSRFLLFAGLSISSQSAWAAALASDSYEPSPYSAGTAIENSSGVAINGGSGFLTQDVDNPFRTNVTTATQNLQYSSGSVVADGGTLALAISGAAISSNLLTRTFDSQSGTVYFSLLLRTSAVVDDDFLQFGFSDVATGEPKLSLGYSQTTVPSAASPLFFVRSGQGQAVSR